MLKNCSRDALFKMTLLGLLSVSTEPVDATAVIGERPIADVLVRRDAERGEPTTANLRHERIAFDPAALAVVPAMNGENDRAALAAVLAYEAKAGRLQFNKDGMPVTDIATIDATALQHIDTVITGIARAGLIVEK